MLYLSLLVLSASLQSAWSGCCSLHVSEAGCLAETANSCQWLPTTHAQYDPSKSQCVSKQYVSCQEQTGPCPIPTDPQPMCGLAQCTEPQFIANVMVVVDESASVQKANYETSLTFIENLVLKSVNSVSSVYLMAFGGKLDLITQDWTRDKAKLEAAIQEERGDYAQTLTCTGKALDAAVTAFQSAPSADKNFLFLITDGLPYCPNKPSKEKVCKYKQHLHNADVEVVIIGVEKERKKLNLKKVECLANATNIHKLSGFDPEQFYSLQSQFRPMLCPQTPSSVPMTEVLANQAALVGQATSSFLAQRPLLWGSLIVVAAFALCYYFRRAVTSKYGKDTSLLMRSTLNTQYNSV